MFLQKYNFVVNYVPGKDPICSETLSRASLKAPIPKILETEVNCKVHSVIFSFPISAEKVKRNKRLKEKTLDRVASYIAQAGQNCEAI